MEFHVRHHDSLNTSGYTLLYSYQTAAACAVMQIAARNLISRRELCQMRLELPARPVLLGTGGACLQTAQSRGSRCHTRTLLQGGSGGPRSYTSQGTPSRSCFSNCCFCACGARGTDRPSQGVSKLIVPDGRRTNGCSRSSCRCQDTTGLTAPQSNWSPAQVVSCRPILIRHLQLRH